MKEYLSYLASNAANMNEFVITAEAAVTSASSGEAPGRLLLRVAVEEMCHLRRIPVERMPFLPLRASGNVIFLKIQLAL